MKKDNASSLRVAIIGCGRVSVKHIKAIRKLFPLLTLCALVDTQEGAGERLLESTKASREGVSFYSDYHIMLTEQKPDIVAITVPSGLHHTIAIDCLRCGAHLLLEKPMTMTHNSAHELYTIATETNRKIAMGHIYRYFPIVSTLHEDIAAGVFGKLSSGSVIVRWGHDESYYGTAAWRGTWKSDGGALMNQSIHALDLAAYLMNADAVAVTGKIAKRFRAIEAEDTAMGVFSMNDGSLCQIEGTTATDPKDHEASFFINGENGSIRISLRKNKPHLSIVNAKGKSQTFRYIRRFIREKGLGFTINSAKNQHFAIYADLVDSIQSGKEPIADAKSGYTAVDMVLGLYKSALDERTISLPLTDDFSSSDMQKYTF